MSDLIAIAFDSEAKAGEALEILRGLEKEHLVDLEDACVVVRHEDGKFDVKQATNLKAAGALSGALWGLLIGLLFMVPVFGLLFGAAFGVIGGALSNVGIDKDFVREIGNRLEPGTSALFLLVVSATGDKVIPQLQPLDGTVVQTSLSTTDEAELRAALKASGVDVDAAEETAAQALGDASDED